MIILTIKSAFWLILLSIFSSGLYSQAYGQASTIVAKQSVPQIENLSPAELLQAGLSQFEAKQYHLAIKTLLAFLQLEPDNLEAYNAIGMSFGEMEEYSAAITAFNQAIAIEQNFANAYYNRGYAHKQLGHYNLALADFNRALELTDNQHISALINRSLIYVFQEEYQLAVADLTHTVELKPDEATAYYNRALINLTIGDRSAYQKDLDTAESLYRQAEDKTGLAQIERVREFNY